MLVGTLEGVASQMKYLRDSQSVELLPPHVELLGTLLGKYNFPITNSHCRQQSVIAPIVKAVAWALLSFPCEIRQEIIAIKVVVVAAAVDVYTGFQLFRNRWPPRR